MTVLQLQEILHALPAESVVQIQYYDQDYEKPRITAVSSICFKERYRIKNETEDREPNRVILS